MRDDPCSLLPGNESGRESFDEILDTLSERGDITRAAVREGCWDLEGQRPWLAAGHGYQASGGDS
jgi:hypothetical protein